MAFELLGDVTDIEIIASGRGVRQRRRLLKVYGGRNWRKLKGVAKVRLPDGAVRWAEIHWYEGHGIGGKELKLKRVLPERP